MENSKLEAPDPGPRLLTTLAPKRFFPEAGSVEAAESRVPSIMEKMLLSKDCILEKMMY